MIKAQTDIADRISQGDIFKDVEFIEYVQEKNGIQEVSKIIFPLVIVLTQDCDLKQDNKFRENFGDSQDKLLLSVLVAPLYNAEHVYRGEHLADINLSMRKIESKKTEGNFLRNNETPRYHFMEFSGDIPIVPSIIDFKHYFSVNVNYLKTIKRTNFICKVSELYRENISHRFAHFLSRIGLPQD